MPAVIKKRREFFMRSLHRLCTNNGREAALVAWCQAAVSGGQKISKATLVSGRRSDVMGNQLACGGDFGLRGLARQWIVGAVIQLPDAVAVETLLFDLEICAKQQLRRQFLDGETDRLGSSREALIADWAARLSAAARKQFRRGTVVDHRHNQ